MGKNTLGKFMKDACDHIGSYGKKITNHFVRKTMIQRLTDSRFTPNEVAQLSGHKNLKSLDSYMTASDKTQRKMSLSLSKEGSISSTTKACNCVPQAVQNDVATTSMSRLSGLFNNDVMINCTFKLLF